MKKYKITEYLGIKCVPRKSAAKNVRKGINDNNKICVKSYTTSSTTRYYCRY